jgi:hypothetical protein
MDEKPPSVEISPSRVQPDSTNVAFPTADATPQPVLVTPTPQRQYIQGNTQATAPGMVQQQMMYVPLKYNPQPNYRTISYIVLGAGFVLSIMLSITAEAMKSAVVESLGSLICCGAFTAVVFLDAAFYKGKADWQQAHGMPSGGSSSSMVLELIIGGILVIFFVLTLLSAILEIV